MVKGVTRRVILVDPTDKRRFEKAIFILREGGQENAEDLLLRAQEIAGRAMGAEEKPRKRLASLLYLLIGAAFTGLLWLAVSLCR